MAWIDLDLIIFVVKMSSSSSSPRRSPEPQEKPTPHKVFATNLDIEMEPAQLESQLFTMFAKYGKLESVVVKRSYNNRYSFAFIQFKEGEDATQAVQDLNNTSINGKKIRVELQDNARRRKGPDDSRQPPNGSTRSDACFACGKTGHIAKNCRQNKDREERRRRSRSKERSRSVERRRRSRSEEKPSKKKSKKKQRSSSSSRSERRDRKERSRKIKKSKHKSRRHSSSSS